MTQSTTDSPNNVQRGAQITGLSPQRVDSLIATYRDGLLYDMLPFWINHGVDREYGGFMTALDRDGTIIDTDKGMWQQGRFTWLLATLYNWWCTPLR